jgi:hypothetical protein
MLLGEHKISDPRQELFKIHVKKFEMPSLEQSIIEDVYDELELLGFPVSMSHFDILKTKFRGEIASRDLMKNLGRKVRMVGNLVTIKNVYTIKKEYMHFGNFLDHEGEFFDTVHFPPSLKQYPFRGYGIYLILGKVVEEFGFPSIEVEKMAKLPVVSDPRY